MESLTQLDHFVQYLEDHPDAQIQINAYVHPVSNRRKAKKISKQRAAAVCDYLVSKDILNKLFYQGYIVSSEGDEKKVLDEQMNWVEFKITSDQ